MKIFWAGFVENKIHVEESLDSYGDLEAAQLFVNRTDAKKRYEDVRKVKVTEVK